MKKLKKPLIIIIFFACLAMAWTHTQLILQNPFHKLTYRDIVFATIDSEDNKLIIDSSGHRLIKVNNESKAEFYIDGKKESGKGFNEAKRVVTDSENNIYLLNIIREEGGRRVKREEIVKYSKHGRYLGIAYHREYKNPEMNERIAGLYCVNGELAFMYKEDNAFSLYNKDGKLVRTYSSDSANLMISSIAVDDKGDAVYYCTKKGVIYKYLDGVSDRVMYDSTSSDILSIPREISCDNKGSIFFTDIGLRTVSAIDKKGDISHEIVGKELTKNIADKYIYYYANANNGLIAVSSDHVVFGQNGDYIHSYGAGYEPKVLIDIILVWVALAIIAAVLLWALISAILLIIKKGTKTFKLIAAVIIGVVSVAGIFLMFALPGFQNKLIDAMLKREEVVASLTAKMLPKKEFQNLDEPSDFMGEDYRTVRKCLKSIFMSGDKNMDDLYCVMYSIQNNVITCTYSLQEDGGTVYPYDWEYKDSDEQWIMKNGKGLVYKNLSDSEGNFIFVLNPIFDDNQKTIGLIEVGADLNSFKKETNRMIFELFLNVLAITVVVILVALEVIIFTQEYQKYKRIYKNHTGGKPVIIPNGLMRIMVFGIFLITNITTSFFPLYAINIAKNSGITFIPKEIIAAIPISAEVVFGAIFSIYGNVVINKLGQKKAAILGSILFSSGLLIRIVIPSIWILTIGNCITGSGWGILLLIVNTIIAIGKEDEKNKGFAGYSAAALNGINCGVVFGGFLVNWLSYIAIFIFAFVLSILIFVYVIMFMAKYSSQEVKNVCEEKTESISFVHFIKNKDVLKFFLLIAVPVISCSYFLNYLFPILGSKYGLSETNIGYSYLLNGLCVICFSNILTEYLSKKVKKEYSLVIASLIYAAAFFYVATRQNVFALLVALVLLGLSDSFGLPLQTSYYTDLDIVKKYGYDKSIGFYSLIENISQSASSFIFSYVLIIGVKRGLYMVLGVVASLAVLFGICTILKNKGRKCESQIS